MDLAQFKSDLKDLECITNHQNNVTDLYNQYDSVLSDLVDCYAHPTIKMCSSHATDPLITSEALNANGERVNLSVCGWQTLDLCSR